MVKCQLFFNKYNKLISIEKISFYNYSEYWLVFPVEAEILLFVCLYDPIPRKFLVMIEKIDTAPKLYYILMEQRNLKQSFLNPLLHI